MKMEELSEVKFSDNEAEINSLLKDGFKVQKIYSVSDIVTGEIKPMVVLGRV